MSTKASKWPGWLFLAASLLGFVREKIFTVLPRCMGWRRSLANPSVCVVTGLTLAVASSGFAQSEKQKPAPSHRASTPPDVSSMFGAATTRSPQVVSYTQDKISLELPSGWTEMEDSQLQQIRKAASTSGLPAIDYRHGFLPEHWVNGSCATLTSKSGPWSFYSNMPVHGSCVAYGVVQFAPRGSLSEHDFADPERLRKLQGHALNLLGQLDAQANASNVQFENSHYDSVRHLLWQEFAVRHPDGMVVRGVSGTFLTSEGTIQVHGFSSESSFASLLPEFQKIISSLRLDPSLEYHPSPWDRLPPSGLPLGVRLVGHGLIVLLSITGIVWALTRQQRAQR